MPTASFRRFVACLAIRARVLILTPGRADYEKSSDHADGVGDQEGGNFQTSGTPPQHELCGGEGQREKEAREEFPNHVHRASPGHSQDRGGLFGPGTNRSADDSAETPGSTSRHPLAVGSEWAARITTIAIMMVLPGIFGQWLDERWETQFLGMGGFIFGNVAGIWYLLKMTGAEPTSTNRN